MLGQLIDGQFAEFGKTAMTELVAGKLGNKVDGAIESIFTGKAQDVAKAGASLYLDASQKVAESLIEGGSTIPKPQSTNSTNSPYTVGKIIKSN